MAHLLPWLLWMIVRQHWARVWKRALFLNERDVDRILDLLTLPGAGNMPSMSFPRDIRAAHSAMTRVRLGADPSEVTGSLWASCFYVVPSDMVGGSGPVRMLLVHAQGRYVTALPWAVPEAVTAAFAATREIVAHFEDEAVA